MSIKVAIFDDRPTNGKALYDHLGFYDFKPVLIDSNTAWRKFSNFQHLDVAIIHVSYWLENLNIHAKEVIAQLPKNCLRVLTSGHTIYDYKKEAMELGGDYYVQFFEDVFMRIMQAGRVDSEQIKLRGFSIQDEDGKVYRAEIGLAPDGDMLDDGKYITMAKRGERR